MSRNELGSATLKKVIFSWKTPTFDGLIIVSKQNETLATTTVESSLAISKDDIYLFGQGTWLGCAEKLGFVECNRNIGTREVDGQCYDGLTFRLEE